MDKHDKNQKATQDLLDLMARLRNPDGGCPWDLEQDFKSIAPHTIEEAYEVADAIERGDMNDLKDELGDLLLQVVFHAQMAEEEGLFDFADVARHVTDKMVHRHPHVFGDETAATGDDVLHGIWEQQKDKEKKRTECESVLDDVTRALPAMMRAQKLQKRAARIGFEWPDTQGAWHKLDEELGELREAITEDDQNHIHEELGDVLYCVVNLGRMLGVDCETAMRDCNYKFESRFKAMEKKLKKIDSPSLTKMLEIWQAQK
ncbi:MAG: nucleoside triphosphate pyrophosphohydrolase [Rhodospirillales bacterium]|nr:nucleoside triphosphate pyrophosphohydrolase [Rhodospirillales bacterium]